MIKTMENLRKIATNPKETQPWEIEIKKSQLILNEWEMYGNYDLWIENFQPAIA